MRLPSRSRERVWSGRSECSRSIPLRSRQAFPALRCSRTGSPVAHALEYSRSLGDRSRFDAGRCWPPSSPSSLGPARARGRKRRSSDRPMNEPTGELAAARLAISWRSGAVDGAAQLRLRLARAVCPAVSTCPPPAPPASGRGAFTLQAAPSPARSPLLMSSWPAWRSFSAAMTRPMSLMRRAPVSATIASIAALALLLAHLLRAGSPRSPRSRPARRRPARRGRPCRTARSIRGAA